MKLMLTKNFAAYARKMLIDGYIIQIDHSGIKAMTAEVQKIGVNVNQIARRSTPRAAYTKRTWTRLRGAE